MGQVLQTNRHNRPVFTGELRDVSHRSDRHNLHKRRDLRFASVFPEQRVNQFESDSDAGEVLVRVFTPKLIWIEHGKSRWRTFFFVRQMVIGDDHVEPDLARPVEWFVRANAAVNTDHELAAIGESLFECCLLNAVAFGETMRDMKADVCAEEFQRAQEDRGSSCSVNVVIAIDQHALTVCDGVLQTRDGLFHAEHGIRLVKLIVSWRKEDPRSALVGVSTGYEKSSQDW